MRLSVIVPCYREEATIAALLERLAFAHTGADGVQVVVVDDGSDDRTAEIAGRAVSGREGWSLIRLPRNRGKGAAIAAAIDIVDGDAVLIQDADLEYDPADIAALVAAYEPGTAVFGSRILGKNGHSSLLYYAGGRALTAVANMLYGIRLTDMPTGYKLMPTAAIREMRLRSGRFEFCAEVSAKLARMRIPITEVPITYAPRSMAEGKKIRARDGLDAIFTLLRYRGWRPEKTS
jgi:dolichol-phosphate mannosyltransferase